MSTKLRFFSDPSSGKSDRQQKFEDLYVGYGFDVLPIILEAHQRTLTEASKKAPEFIDKPYWAQEMNRNMVGIMKQKYPHLIHFDEAKRLYIKLGDSARVYFKKLDKGYKPRNIPTGHVIELNSAQGQLFGKDLTVLYAGPRLKLDNIWDEIDCFLVEMRTLTKCEWVSDLSDLSSRMGGGTIHMVPPSTPPVAPPAIAVKLKAKQEDGDLDQNQAISN